MPDLTAAARTGLAAAALGLAMSACGAGAPSADNASESATPSAAATPPPATTSPPQAGNGQTLDSYLHENNITKTPVHPGDPGPVVDLPAPEGWKRAAVSADAPFGGLVQSQPVNPSDPPRINAALFRLTGNADPVRVLQLAPADLQSIPGFQLMGDYYDGTIAGFKSKQAGGSYSKDGNSRLIAQKTVAIPAQNALFVLQLTADGLESDIGPMMAATSAIDKELKITP
jgi:Probable lipoprotein LpqN